MIANSETYSRIIVSANINPHAPAEPSIVRYGVGDIHPEFAGYVCTKIECGSSRRAGFRFLLRWIFEKH